MATLAQLMHFFEHMGSKFVAVVITDLCGYQQKSMKMKTTRFNFLFLVKIGFVAIAAGKHKIQGYKSKYYYLLYCKV